MNTHSPVFIVGTGRCGSTLLSSMLRLHPAILSLSEFLTFLRPYTFSADQLDGADFWAMLSTPRTAHTVLLRHGLGIEEFLYPRLTGTRYRSTEGIPPILLTTLPHLSSDPDGLYDEVGAFVCALPTAPLAEQYLRLFGWLCARFERTLWIERSGVSLDLVPQLIHHFPDARFVHLYRDGRECAVSMSRHHYFRLVVIGRRIAQALGADPYDSPQSPPADGAPPALRALLPETFDAAAYNAVEIPPSRFGAIWSSLIAKGLVALSQVPPHRVLSLNYGALVASPQSEMRRLMDFVGPDLAPAGWLDTAAALVRPRPAAWKDLPAAEARLLGMVCRPGEQLLRQVEREGAQSLPITAQTLEGWLAERGLPSL
jgi:putative sulfotransferase